MKSISKLIQKQLFTLCTYNSTFYNLIGALRSESTLPHVTKKSLRTPGSHFASTRVPGDNTTVMIHAINYLTTTNLGVASAHP